jgi:SAM-dependent MidA family methyltransferase
LARGAVLVLDYGHEAARLADAAHADGTLIAYRGHRSSTKLLDDPGRQDLTAHVHWDRLEEFARRAGFALAGRTAQDRFLLALGIAEEMTGTHPEALAARALVLPADAGKSFSASLWLKGVELQPRGLRWPP